MQDPADSAHKWQNWDSYWSQPQATTVSLAGGSLFPGESGHPVGKKNRIVKSKMLASPQRDCSGQ